MAKTQIKAHQCPNCTAPLPVGTADNSVRCQYCGMTITIQRAKKTMNVPPPQQGVPQTTLYLATGAASAGAAIWGVIGSVLLSMGIGAAVFFAKRGFVGGSGRSISSLPAVCAVNEKIEIVDKKFDFQGTAIKAGTNCKITIRNSTIKATQLLQGESNVELTIDNSALEGTQKGLVTGVNCKLKLDNKSTIKSSEGSAVDAQHNLELTSNNSKIEGKENAIKANSNLKLHANNTEISSQEIAIETSHNPKINLEESTIVSQSTAIKCAGNLELEMRGGQIEAEDAIQTPHGLKAKLKKKAKIVAKQNALVSDSGADLSLDDSTIEAKDTAIKFGSSGNIELKKGSLIKGGQKGLEAKNSFTLRMRDSVLEGGETAIAGGYSGTIDANKSKIKGGTHAISMSTAPSMNLKDSEIIGEQVTTSMRAAGPSSPKAELLRALQTASKKAVDQCISFATKGKSYRVSLRIQASGAVQAVTISPAEPPELTGCMEKSIKSTTFPSGTSDTSISLPIIITK